MGTYMCTIITLLVFTFIIKLIYRVKLDEVIKNFVSGAKKSKGKYYPKYTGNSNSIVEALKAVGEDDVSKEHRAEIAKKNGFSNFKFTSEENSKMISLLKKGKLKK